MAGLAEQARQWFKQQDKSGLVVTEKPATKTGYEFICNVDPEGRYPFQARIKVKVDGEKRGTLRTLPGLFETALEAAQYRALLLQQGGQDCLGPPRKQRPRTSAGKLVPYDLLTCAFSHCGSVCARRTEENESSYGDPQAEQASWPALRVQRRCSVEHAANERQPTQ